MTLKGWKMLMRRTLIAFILLSVMMTSVVSADVFRFMGTGAWEDSQWQNQTTGDRNVAPPTSADVARMNWGGGTCTLSSNTEILQLMTGVDEPGTLVVADGGHLTTGVHGRLSEATACHR